MNIQLLCVVLLNTIANVGVGSLLPIMPVLLRDYGFSVAGLSLPFFAIVFWAHYCEIFLRKVTDFSV